MSIVDTHRRQLDQLKERSAGLHRELSRHRSEEAKARDAERRQTEQAVRSKSAPTIQNYLNAAERHRKKAVDAGKRAADVEAKIARNSKEQTNKQKQIQLAERTAQQAADREADSRRRKEKEHAREVARLSAPQVHFVHIQPPEPEKLRVLYMTANPSLDLRTDNEVRQVQQSLRGARYRDLVELQQRPAATFQDLLDGLNDVRPHIVHFSGHAGDQSVQFDRGDTEHGIGELVGFGLLMKALAATDHPPRLLVLNACDTLYGSESILPAVPVVIAMSDAVLDTAAILFAAQFYAAIGSGQSVGAALKQGRLKVEAAMLDDTASELPQHVARDDVDIDQLILVRPEELANVGHKYTKPSASNE